MEIKELAKMIALCRKTGVTTFRYGDIEFTLGPDPKAVKRSVRRVDPANDIPEAKLKVPQYTPVQGHPGEDVEKSQALKEALTIATDEMTPEQLMFYSSGSPTDHLSEQ